ncbi:MAG: type II secretion system F family protein, partial [Lentisphaeria bacterium]|nr:type II secretion system F family protein [Lentisphaeria bacterium]NQZ68359.1 type II secretion system F family protein [Lentisphaeria bacterium]
FDKENNKAQLDKTQQQLIMGGLENHFRALEFISMRFIYTGLMLIVGLICLLLSTQIEFGISASMTKMLGFCMMIIGALYPSFWLRGVIKLRHKSIQRELPNVLDLLTLSVEAGRDFLSALKEILANREPDPLGEELERVFREIQLGKQRRQALNSMSQRVQQADLSTVVDTLTQADELGVSIGHILRILGEQMRQKRFAYAEKLANESPVKLLFPLFIFIFPAVIIVMLGPVLLKYLTQI